MKTLKDHQATMVYMLSQETAIPTSAVRLAHALHDVLAHLNNTNVAPVAHTERRSDATTPGLNDAMLAQDIAAVKPKQQSLESLLKQRDNTIRQLKGRIMDLSEELEQVRRLQAVAEREVISRKSAKANQCHVAHVNFDAPKDQPPQAGCRKEDTEVPDDVWVEWGGGACPVNKGTPTEVMFRAGATGVSTDPEFWNWSRDDSPLDIIAYRVVKS